MLLLLSAIEVAITLGKMSTIDDPLEIFLGLL
jgi:hypothetical protein